MKQENTSLRCSLASNYHRILGSRIYTTDMDSLFTNSGIIDESFIEFSIDKKNDFVPYALIDYKKMIPNRNQHFSDKYIGVRSQAAIADNYLKIPFFVVLYYLDECWEDKGFLIVPVNNLAKKYFSDLKLSDSEFMSVKKFSQMLHHLRNIKWNANEEVDNSNFPEIKCLGDLPNKKLNYAKPTMDFGYYK
jgi:hypothetical protein